MAVSILGSGTTPVTGTREFDPIPGGVPPAEGGGGLSIISGDVNNYIMTSTGTGDELQGESNLTFNGTTLTISGSVVINTGTLTATAVASGVTSSVLNYNTSSGLITYNSGGGGGTTYLRDDGVWATPAGAGDVSKVGTPSNNEIGVWTGNGTLEGDSNFTITSGDLILAGSRDFTVSGGDIYVPSISSYSTGSAVVVHWDNALGQLQKNSSGGGTTNFLRADGSWAAPPGAVTVSGPPSSQQVATWSSATNVTGSSNLTFSGSLLTIAGGVTLTNGKLTLDTGNIDAQTAIQRNIRSLLTVDNSTGEVEYLDGSDAGNDTNWFLSAAGTWDEVGKIALNHASNPPAAGYLAIWTGANDVKGVPGFTFSEGEVTNSIDMTDKTTEIELTGVFLVSSGSINLSTLTANSFFTNDGDTYEAGMRGSYNSRSSKLWVNDGALGIKGYNALNYVDTSGYADIYVAANEAVVYGYNGASGTGLTVNGDSLALTGIPTYADNAAAKTGGLSDNDVYRTSTGQLMIVYT